MGNLISYALAGMAVGVGIAVGFRVISLVVAPTAISAIMRSGFQGLASELPLPTSMTTTFIWHRPGQKAAPESEGPAKAVAKSFFHSRVGRGSIHGMGLFSKMPLPKSMTTTFNWDRPGQEAARKEASVNGDDAPSVSFKPAPCLNALGLPLSPAMRRR